MAQTVNQSKVFVTHFFFRTICFEIWQDFEIFNLARVCICGCEWITFFCRNGPTSNHHLDGFSNCANGPIHLNADLSPQHCSKDSSILANNELNNNRMKDKTMNEVWKDLKTMAIKCFNLKLKTVIYLLCG